MWRSACKIISCSVHAVLCEIPESSRHPRHWRTLGSAFAIRSEPQPFLITSAHVVCDDAGIPLKDKRLALMAFLPNTRGAVAGIAVRYLSKEYDIAILEASTNAKEIVPMTFEPPSVLEVGTAIATMGFPIPDEPETHPGGGSLLVEKRIATGFVSRPDIKANFDRESESLLHYELNMLTYSGLSGAPIFDICGFVVGMNRGGMEFCNIPVAYAYAVRGIEIIKYLSENHIPYFARET